MLSDTIAPNCAGSVTLPTTYPGTWSNFATAGSGNHTDNILQVGEYFEYTCDKGNTTVGYTNTARVDAQGNTSNTPVNDDDPTPVLVQNTITPQILIDKRDANSADIDTVVGNDTQTVVSGNAAIFKIRVTNNGTEDLKNLVLSDTIAPNCAGSVTLPTTYPGTWSNFATAGSGNHTDNILQVGEYFEYTCDKGNTTVGYTNTARVDAQGNTSNTPVNDDDPTPVLVQTSNPTCDNLSVTTSGNTVSYNCTGTGNITNYSILQNGGQISTSSSGSVTL